MTKQFNPCVECGGTENPIIRLLRNPYFTEIVIACVGDGCKFRVHQRLVDSERLRSYFFDEKPLCRIQQCENVLGRRYWNKANPLPEAVALKKCCGEEPEESEYTANGNTGWFWECMTCHLTSPIVGDRKHARVIWQALDHKPTPKIDEPYVSEKELERLIGILIGLKIAEGVNPQELPSEIRDAVWDSFPPRSLEQNGLLLKAVKIIPETITDIEIYFPQYKPAPESLEEKRDRLSAAREAAHEAYLLAVGEYVRANIAVRRMYEH